MQKIRVDINIGSNLRDLRKQHNLTQDQTVAKLGVLGIEIPRSTYARFETGELNVPVSVLVALRSLYRCSYDNFFEGLNIEPK